MKWAAWPCRQQPSWEGEALRGGERRVELFWWSAGAGAAGLLPLSAARGGVLAGWFLLGLLWRCQSLERGEFLLFVARGINYLERPLIDRDGGSESGG